MDIKLFLGVSKVDFEATGASIMIAHIHMYHTSESCFLRSLIGLLRGDQQILFTSKQNGEKAKRLPGSLRLPRTKVYPQTRQFFRKKQEVATKFGFIVFNVKLFNPSKLDFYSECVDYLNCRALYKYKI